MPDCGNVRNEYIFQQNSSLFFSRSGFTVLVVFIYTVRLSLSYLAISSTMAETFQVNGNGGDSRSIINMLPARFFSLLQSNCFFTAYSNNIRTQVVGYPIPDDSSLLHQFYKDGVCNLLFAFTLVTLIFVFIWGSL